MRVRMRRSSLRQRLHDADVAEEDVDMSHAPIGPERVDELQDCEAALIHEAEVFVDRRCAEVVREDRAFEQDELCMVQRLSTACQYVELRSLNIRLDEVWKRQSVLLDHLIERRSQPRFRGYGCIPVCQLTEVGIA